jgi:hypothetical protein
MSESTAPQSRSTSPRSENFACQQRHHVIEQNENNRERDERAFQSTIQSRIKAATPCRAYDFGQTNPSRFLPGTLGTLDRRSPFG